MGPRVNFLCGQVLILAILLLCIALLYELVDWRHAWFRVLVKRASRAFCSFTNSAPFISSSNFIFKIPFFSDLSPLLSLCNPSFLVVSLSNSDKWDNTITTILLFSYVLHISTSLVGLNPLWNISLESLKSAKTNVGEPLFFWPVTPHPCDHCHQRPPKNKSLQRRAPKPPCAPNARSKAWIHMRSMAMPPPASDDAPPTLFAPTLASKAPWAISPSSAVNGVNKPLFWSQLFPPPMKQLALSGYSPSVQLQPVVVAIAIEPSLPLPNFQSRFRSPATKFCLIEGIMTLFASLISFWHELLNLDVYWRNTQIRSGIKIGQCSDEIN